MSRADKAIKRFREAVNYLCEYSTDNAYGYRFALEAKPNEPRACVVQVADLLCYRNKYARKNVGSSYDWAVS